MSGEEASDQQVPDPELSGGQVLRGGVGNAGAVVRVGDEVHRPVNPHTATHHALLRHVRTAGFDAVPEPLGVLPEGRERLRFIPGEVAVPPFPAWSQTDEILAGTARLLRRYHDATVGFLARHNANRWLQPPEIVRPSREDGAETVVEVSWDLELADPLAGGADDVVGHNDVCPENVVVRDGVPIALLDFDFAAPGRRVWDLACFARMCVPIEDPVDLHRTGREGLDAFSRLRLVADAYGLRPDRQALVDALGHQVEHGVAFVQRRVDAGEAAFVEMWTTMGGEARYERRRRWFVANRERLLEAVG